MWAGHRIAGGRGSTTRGRVRGCAGEGGCGSHVLKCCITIDPKQRTSTRCSRDCRRSTRVGRRRRRRSRRRSRTDPPHACRSMSACFQPQAFQLRAVCAASPTCSAGHFHLRPKLSFGMSSLGSAVVMCQWLHRGPRGSMSTEVGVSALVHLQTYSDLGVPAEVQPCAWLCGSMQSSLQSMCAGTAPGTGRRVRSPPVSKRWCGGTPAAELRCCPRTSRGGAEFCLKSVWSWPVGSACIGASRRRGGPPPAKRQRSTSSPPRLSCARLLPKTKSITRGVRKATPSGMIAESSRHALQMSTVKVRRHG